LTFEHILDRVKLNQFTKCLDHLFQKFLTGHTPETNCFTWTTIAVGIFFHVLSSTSRCIFSASYKNQI